MKLAALLEPVPVNLPLLVLLTCVLMSAIAVIVVKHHSRLAFVELQQAEKHRDHLNEEWGRLLLEESTWASPARVEQEASSRLNMLVPTNDMTVVQQ
jgi:cell division protein FtsL